MNNLYGDLQSYTAGIGAIPRLSAAGLKGLDKLSPVQIAALGGMSDSELSIIVKTQSLSEFCGWDPNQPFPSPYLGSTFF